MSFTANSRLVGKLFWRALREFQSRSKRQRMNRPKSLVAPLGSRLKD